MRVPFAETLLIACAMALAQFGAYTWQTLGFGGGAPEPVAGDLRVQGTQLVTKDGAHVADWVGGKWISTAGRN